MVAVSPKLGEFLTKATQTADLETALWRVLLEYVQLKSNSLKERVSRYERKWQMSFAEFSRRCKDGTLSADPYSWEVEQDYWEWEQAATLLQHYDALNAS